jgi:dipeptidyl-peptidase-4
VRVKWLPEGDRIALQTLDRAHQKLDLWFADRSSGRSKHVLTETDEGWVNIHDDLVFLKDGKHFLWVSERDGWSHLYRYTMDGEMVAQETKGPWALHSATPIFWLRQAVQGMDEDEGWIYFGALEASPLETHLYRKKPGSDEIQRITEERGVHSLSLSPDARFFLDEHSSASTPPSLSLRRADGTLVAALSPAKSDLVQALGIRTPELFTIAARDGIPMPAWLYKPGDFDPARRYPLILHVYGGPSSRTVTDAWDNDACWNQILLRKGYLVASVDNRSATGASKKLENTIAGRMTGDGELNDLLDAVAWFKAQTFVDRDRVGIWGWSNGGMMTLLGMTRSAEFRAGISVAPVTDWTYYDTIWAETVNKRPQDNPQGYAETNLVRRAKDLHGRLLLVHGTYDDNVHIQNTWHFVDELVKANKLFELMIYPMRQHGIADRPARIHLFNTMLEFWSRSL